MVHTSIKQAIAVKAVSMLIHEKILFENKNFQSQQEQEFIY